MMTYLGNGRIRVSSISVQKAKKQAEKAGKGGKPATAAKQWPPAKDVKADVEFIFQAGLEKEEEMTMGKIYKELGGLTAQHAFPLLPFAHHSTISITHAASLVATIFSL